MARNEEKLFGRLNRVHLQKQREAELLKNPTRPKLSSLNSADAVRQWLPTISRDLEQHLMQLEVPCYPERVIRRIRHQISSLKAEYEAFTAKIKEFESADKKVATITQPEANTEILQKTDKPSTEIGAIDRRLRRSDTVFPPSSASESNGESPTTTMTSSSSRIALPLLDGDVEQRYTSEAIRPPVVWNCDERVSDEPLELKPPSVHQRIAARLVNRYGGGHCRRATPTTTSCDSDCYKPARKAGRYEHTVAAAAAAAADDDDDDDTHRFRYARDARSLADVRTHALTGKNALEALTAAYSDDDDDDDEDDDSDS